MQYSRKENKNYILESMMPYIKFPSLVLLPTLIFISLVQIASPTNVLIFNIAILITILKLSFH